MDVTRISFRHVDKRKMLLHARRAFNAILAQNLEMPRHEHIRTDGRSYIDVDASQEAVEAAIGETDVGDVEYEDATLSAVDECLNCGNVADKPFCKCPSCGHVEIAPCAYCGENVPRLEYRDAEGELSRCPRCGERVRMAFKDPLWRDDGTLNEPVVEVRKP